MAAAGRTRSFVLAGVVSLLVAVVRTLAALFSPLGRRVFNRRGGEVNRLAVCRNFCASV